jgi:type II secretory pathway component PulF
MVGASFFTSQYKWIMYLEILLIKLFLKIVKNTPKQLREKFAIKTPIIYRTVAKYI